MPRRTLHAVWTPEDAEALAASAAQFPREIAESPVFADIVEREGLL